MAFGLWLNHKLYAVCTVTVSEDTLSGNRNLYVYSLGSFTPVELAGWKIAFDTLREYARELGCYRIVTKTNNPRMIQITKHLGGKTDMVAVELEV